MMLRYDCDKPDLGAPGLNSKALKLQTKNLHGHIASHRDEFDYYKRWTFVYTMLFLFGFIITLISGKGLMMLPSMASFGLFLYSNHKFALVWSHINMLLMQDHLIEGMLTLTQMKEAMDDK